MQTRSRKYSGFTLVELLLVIIIMSILSVLSIVSFSGYQSRARDAKRVSQLQVIQRGVVDYYVEEGEYPLPDDYITINNGATVYLYQGVVGDEVNGYIGLKEDAVDPGTGKNYNYVVNYARESYKLVGFLENEFDITSKVNAGNGENINFFGDDIAFYVDTEGTPIDEIESIKASGIFDVSVVDTSLYKVMLKDSSLDDIPDNFTQSCSTRMEFLGDIEDGYYTINPSGDDMNVYCDMTDNGGGWTRYVQINGIFDYDDALDCWLRDDGIKQYKNLECFNPNRYSMDAKYIMVRKKGDTDVLEINTTASYDTEVQRSNGEDPPSFRQCLGNNYYFTIMSFLRSEGNLLDSSEIYDNNKYIRLGLSYCVYAGEYGGVKEGLFLNTASSIELGFSEDEISDGRNKVPELVEFFIK